MWYNNLDLLSISKEKPTILRIKLFTMNHDVQGISIILLLLLLERTYKNAYGNLILSKPNNFLIA